MKIDGFLGAGVMSPLVFWATLYICGLFFDSYSHLSGWVSELGALETRSRYIFSTGLVLCSILNLVFTIRLIVLCKKHGMSIWPAVLLTFFSFLAGPAIVPMPLPLHGTIGLPMLIFFLSPPVGMLLWRNHPHFRVGWIAIISTGFIVLGCLVFSQTILVDYFGLKQRFVYLGWTLWSIGLAIAFGRLKSPTASWNCP